MNLALQLLASALTLLAMWKMGDVSVWGPVIGVISEIVWLVLIVRGKLWGLLPLTAVLGVVHIRNGFLWIGF
jgi:hypothetical protein